MKMIRASVLMAVAAAACVVVAPHPGKAQMLVATAATGDPQVKDDLFAGTEKFAQGASDVTEVNLDKNMLGMVSGKHKGEGKGSGSGSDLAGKMDFVVVHSYSYDKPGMYRMEDVEAYRRKLMDGSWNCFIHTREKDGATDICTRAMPDNETHEMVIMTAEPKELTFVHLRGRLSLNDLGKMGGNIGVPEGSYSLNGRQLAPEAPNPGHPPSPPQTAPAAPR